MKILKIIHGYPPNYNAGSEVYSQSVCNEISKNHKVYVVTREENPYAPCFSIRHEKENENLDLYFVNNPQGKDGYRHRQLDENFARLIGEIKPDIAHIGHLNHLSTGIVDELKKKNIPIVFTLHDFWLMCPRGQFLTRSIGKESNFQLCSGQEDAKCASDCYRVYFSGREENESEDLLKWSRWIRQRMIETVAICEKVDLFIAPSNYLRNRFIQEFGIPEEKIIYLDYGFPTEYLTPTEKSPEKSLFTFGYIGTHITSKGVNLLIEAFSKIKSPSKLLIWGHKDDQSSNALRKMAGSSNNPVEFMGQYINKNLANEVFSKIDCIVVPSIWGENSPLVIHEAQACHIPVITANYGGMKEYVQNMVNGLLFEHRNVESLKEQMQFAIDNPQQMDKFGKRGYLYSKTGKVPSIIEHCQRLFEIYNSFSAHKSLWRITLDTNPEDCNLNCIMCEEHSEYSSFKSNLFAKTGIRNRRMTETMIQNIMKEASELGVQEVIPTTMGDPLVTENFELIASLAAGYGMQLNITHNGTFPRKSVKEWAEIIVPITSDIKISFNGATKETAESIMKGLDFNNAIDNIKEFVSYRDELFVKNGHYCKVSLQLTFMNNNMNELAYIVKLAASLNVDRIKGHHLWTHFTQTEHLALNTTAEGIEKWNTCVNQAYEAQEMYLRPNGEKVVFQNIIPIINSDCKEVSDDYECPFLGKELWISATGEISPCCAPDHLRKSLGCFGNIENTSLLEVLESSSYIELLNNYKLNPLCKTCNMRKQQSI